MYVGRYISLSHLSVGFTGQACFLSITTGKGMFKRPSASDDRSFYSFIALFLGTVLIAAISSSEGIDTTGPSSVASRHQENTEEEVRDFQTAQHAGDEADLYADDVLSHFRPGGVCDTYSSTIRRFADSASPVNIRITKINKILDKARKYSCVR
jgi:hypothetical protein